MITVEPISGLCNTLKTFITFLSVGKANIKCRPEFESLYGCQAKDFDSILDERHICQNDSEYGKYVTGWRFLVLETEEDEQSNLENEIPGEPSVIGNIRFSSKTIDNFYDRSLLSDKVFNRIMKSIDSICWKPEILSDVEELDKQIVHPALAVSIRTWASPHDPENLTTRTDLHPPRRYNFETYKTAIETFLPNCKTIVLSVDNDNELQNYLELLKGYNVIVCKKKGGNLRHSITQLLLMAKCDYLVCSRLSTYSECIWWFSRCKQKVLPLF